MPRLQTFVLLLKIMFLSYSELFQSAVRNLSQPFIYLTSLKNYTAGIKTYQKVLCRVFSNCSNYYMWLQWVQINAKIKDLQTKIQNLSFHKANKATLFFHKTFYDSMKYLQACNQMQSKLGIYQSKKTPNEVQKRLVYQLVNLGKCLS